MKTYQVEPPDITVIPKILSEVEVLHKCEDESKWMLRSKLRRTVPHSG